MYSNNGMAQKKKESDQKNRCQAEVKEADDKRNIAEK